MNVNITTDPVGYDEENEPVFLSDISILGSSDRVRCPPELRQ